MNPDETDLKAAHGVLLAASTIPEIGALTVYSGQQFDNLRLFVDACNRPEKKHAHAFWGTVGRTLLWGASHAPAIVEFFRNIFKKREEGKSEPK